MKHFLALDLATKTGWAASDGKVITSGVQSFTFDARYEGGGMRFLRFNHWLDKMASLMNIERIAFEEVRQRAASVAAGHVYGGFLAHLTSWCEAHKVPYEGIPVGTIKKHAAGAGNAGKDAIIKAMRAKGHSPKDDNEADALALLYYLLDHATPSNTSVGSPPDRVAQRRVQVGAVPVARRRVSA